VVIADGTPKYGTEIPVGEESTRYILCYRYLALDEKRVLEDSVFAHFARSFLKTPSGVEDSRRRKRDFVKEYGHWGVRQLLKFFLDHWTVKLTRGFTEEELARLFEGINIFLLLYGVQELAKKSGHTILMGVAPGQPIAFKMVANRSKKR
jgi:hypothetical protein